MFQLWCLSLSWKDLFELADIEYWKSSAESWDHGSLRDQMLLCILVLLFSGVVIAVSNVITTQIKVVLDILLDHYATISH
ncbi:hypothetical protein HRED_07474 [Candidatus Haloredivivus sp. G17]|nr:hypothetical protein HRED_07474 [Candidatus Haloredivivus sp. G17]